MLIIPAVRTSDVAMTFETYFPLLVLVVMGALAFIGLFPRGQAMVPEAKKMTATLADGSIGVLSAATTCAAAGIIVGVVTLTGLGLKFSSIVIDFAGGSSAADRALHGAGRLDHRPRRAGDGVLHHLCGDRGAGDDQARRAGLRRAHVHLLLRGALRSVAADRAVAVRGRGDHRRRSRTRRRCRPGSTRCRRSWCRSRSCSTPDGIGLLMKIPKGGDWTNILWITFVTAAGLAALAAAAQGWALRRTLPAERALFILSRAFAGVSRPFSRAFWSVSPASTSLIRRRLDWPWGSVC